MTWHVNYILKSHIAGGMCPVDCGETRIMSEIRGDGKIAHTIRTKYIDDIVDDKGTHIICFGHDYDDYGGAEDADLLLIVQAVNHWQSEHICDVVVT